MSEDEEGNEIKMTIIGNPGVGKTCIISRYIDDTFNENIGSTIGVNFLEKTIKINEKEVTLNIWDTAGQEKFHSLGKHFYKDSYVIIFVYDITDQESLNSLKEIWYPELLKNGEKYTILAVVGNKSDLYENNDLANEDQAKAFAKEINATFFSTSAKNGDGVEKLFTTLAQQYLSPEFSAKAKEMIKRRGPSFSVGEIKDKRKNKKGCC